MAQWSDLPDLQFPRVRPRVIPLSDRGVLVFGGTVSGYFDGNHWATKIVEQAEILSAGRDRWSLADDLFDPSGRLKGLKAMRFDPLSGEWSETTEISNPNHSKTETKDGGLAGAGMLLLSEGIWLVVGGKKDDQPSGRIFTKDGKGILPTKLKLSDARISPTLTLLSPNRILVTGGYQVTSRFDGELDDSSINSAEIVDLANHVVIPAGRGGTDFDHTGALLPDGSVFLVGGNGNCGTGSRDVYLGKDFFA